MNESDEIDVCDTQQTSVGAQQSYSIYEPNYQQMHPLIYYEDPSHNHHILGSAVSQLWDQEHYVHMPMIPFGDTTNGTCPAPVQTKQADEEEVGEGNEEEEESQQNADSDQANISYCIDNIKREQSDSPQQQTNREVHNEIERRRRLRIKQCCDVLRNLVPGLSDKTDKATVLEHTVKYVNHLSSCPNFNCSCELED